MGANMSYYSQNWNSLDVKGFGNDFFSYKAIAGASKKEDFGVNSDFGLTLWLLYSCVRDMYTIVAIMSRLQVVMMVHLNSEPIIMGILPFGICFVEYYRRGVHAVAECH